MANWQRFKNNICGITTVQFSEEFFVSLYYNNIEKSDQKLRGLIFSSFHALFVEATNKEVLCCCHIFVDAYF